MARHLLKSSRRHRRRRDGILDEELQEAARSDLPLADASRPRGRGPARCLRLQVREEHRSISAATCRQTMSMTVATGIARPRMADPPVGEPSRRGKKTARVVARRSATWNPARPQIIAAIRAMIAAPALADAKARSLSSRAGCPWPRRHAGTLHALDLERVAGRRRCHERGLIVALVQRLLALVDAPDATLAATTLGRTLDLGGLPFRLEGRLSTFGLRARRSTWRQRRF